VDKILLIGSGGHARACIDVIEATNQFEIKGLIEKVGEKNNVNLGYPIIGTDSDLQDLRKQHSYAFITVGQIKSPIPRKKLYLSLKELDFTLPIIISPKAYVSKHSQIGEGTIIMHGAIVNANAIIGKNCIINNCSLIEHDVEIGDHCHISTGAIINGEVSVGDKTFLGSGAIAKQCISIGNNCIIGAGVVVNRDIKPDQLMKK
jgi:sugar O-acyltransferase (sialic acid O-acetyltransferase NeuD family)